MCCDDIPVRSRVPRDRTQFSLELNFLVGKVKYSVRRVRKSK